LNRIARHGYYRQQFVLVTLFAVRSAITATAELLVLHLSLLGCVLQPLHRLAIEARLCMDRSLSSECSEEEMSMIREAGTFTALRQYDTALIYVCLMHVDGNY